MSRRKNWKKRSKLEKDRKMEVPKYFRDQIHNICLSAGLQDGVHLFSKSDLETLCRHRFYPYRFSYITNNGFSDEMKNWTYQIINYYLKGKKERLKYGKPKVSLWDLAVAGQTLYFCLKSKQYYFQNEDLLQTHLLPLLRDRLRNVELYHTPLLTRLLGCAFNRLSFGYFVFSFRPLRRELKSVNKANATTTTKVRRLATINLYGHYIPQKITYIPIGGKTRKVFQLGWQVKNGRLESAQIKASALHLPRHSKYFVFDVYIQSHAIVRLRERLDSLAEMDLIDCLRHALTNPQVVHYDKKFLLPVYYQGVKVGYLLGVLYEYRLVIRTFLFITCASSPEGRLLNEVLHCSKLDLSFLKLDCLSTFVSSDLASNSRIKEILSECNLNALLQFEENRGQNQEQENEKSLAKRFAHYFELNEEISDDSDGDILLSDSLENLEVVEEADHPLSSK